MQYPGPQGLRPSDLAARLRMSKQALNYLLGELERLGYIERLPDPDDLRSRRISVTKRGDAVAAAIREAVAEVEAEWTEQLGPKRFEELRSLLVSSTASNSRPGCGEFLTGMSGTGKSTALAGLARRGFRVVDTDDPPWTEWSDAESGYVWREDLVAELLAGADSPTLYVSGTASNQGSFYGRFDAVVLLSAPAEVLLQRIATRTTNDYGKSAEERELILHHIAEVEPLLRATCTHEIDATQPISACRRAAHRHRTQLVGRDQRVVLDRRERVIEVMEQALPLLIAGRLPEPLRVILEHLPLHEQEIAVRRLDTTQQLQRSEPGARGDDRLRGGERSLELSRSTGLDVENGLLRDHVRIIAERPSAPRGEPSYTRGYTHGGMVTADEGTSLGRHDHHDDPEGNGPHAQAARSGCADRGGVLERRGRRAARHLAPHGEGAFGHVALEAGCEQAPADPGRVQGSDRRGPAFGKPRCAASATGGLTAEGARCISPAPAGAHFLEWTDTAVFSPVNDMAGFPKPRLRRRRILERPRLIRALDRSRAQVRMLVAGAGYGKTTLAEQWAAQEPRVAWVRAKRSSADVAVLARQVAAAAAEILPGSDHRLSERLNATQDPSDELDVLVDLMSQDMAGWPEDAWIIIDDYHLLKESATAEAFVEGIVQQSPVQVLIATRDRPTWVSTRAVLYGEVLEVGQSLLAMSEDEVEEMLAGVHDGISSGLLALAGGWPAVIGLASLTTTDTPLPADGLELPEQLYEFFADEVYRALEPESRIGLGLLATAPSLDRELAAELLGADRAERVCAEALTARCSRRARRPARIPPAGRRIPGGTSAQGDDRRYRNDRREMPDGVSAAAGVGCGL